jgi:hypothetical protein
VFKVIDCLFTAYSWYRGMNTTHHTALVDYICGKCRRTTWCDISISSTCTSREKLKHYRLPVNFNNKRWTCIHLRRCFVCISLYVMLSFLWNVLGVCAESFGRLWTTFLKFQIILFTSARNIIVSSTNILNVETILLHALYSFVYCEPLYRIIAHLITPDDC